MTGPAVPLDDAIIEQALERRVPGHVDDRLLAEISGIAAGTQQERAWPWQAAPPRPATWALLVAAVLLIGALVAIGVGSRWFAQPLPSPFAVVPASATPATSPQTDVPSAPPSFSPTPSISVAERCAALERMITSGSSMPATTTTFPAIPADALDQGAFATHPNGPPARQSDLWSVREGSVTRIASVAGPDEYMSLINDISPDGGQVLYQVLAIDTRSATPFCDDLYVAQSDGSGVTRLLPGAERSGMRGQFSNDGGQVAFLYAEPDLSRSSVGVVDVAGGEPRLLDCDGTSPRARFAWSPNDRRLAALCDGRLVLTVDGVEAGSAPLPAAEIPMAIGWRDANTVLLLTAGGSDSAIAPIKLRMLTVPAFDALIDEIGFSEPLELAPRLTDAGFIGHVAPDGQSIAFMATPDTMAEMGWYTVDVASGQTVNVIDGQLDQVQNVGWSGDSGRIFSIEPGTGPGVIPELTVYDRATGAQRSFLLPEGCGQGVWQGT